MKAQCVAIAIAVALLSGISRADSIDNFLLTGPVYTWSWSLPASPAANDPTWAMHNPPGIFGFLGIDVLTEGPAGFGVGKATSHDLFFETAKSFQLSCNSFCGQSIAPTFTSDLYSGTFADPTFLTGEYITPDGGVTLSITAVPEGSELAMLGITAVGILGAIKKKLLRVSQRLPNWSWARHLISIDLESSIAILAILRSRLGMSTVSHKPATGSAC